MGSNSRRKKKEYDKQRTIKPEFSAEEIRDHRVYSAARIDEAYNTVLRIMVDIRKHFPSVGEELNKALIQLGSARETIKLVRFRPYKPTGSPL